MFDFLIKTEGSMVKKKEFPQRKIEAVVTRSQYLAGSVLLVSCTTRGHAQCLLLVLLAGTYH